MGGLRHLYATTPTNRGTGMRMGGTRDFIDHDMLKKVAAPRTRQASNIMACQYFF
jgi:hypothetical protein